MRSTPWTDLRRWYRAHALRVAHRASRPAVYARLAAWVAERPWWIACLWALPAALLPPIPIDETRYLSIAWEMRQSGDVIGLTLNGQPYMDKSPLLFWLINLAWALLGVSTLVARLVCIGFGAVAVAAVASIATCLRHPRPATAGWMLLPFVVFGAFTPVGMFDVPLVCFVALGFLGAVRWLRGSVRVGMPLFLTACVLGLLAKGPVYLLQLLGPLALVRWWHEGGVRQPWRVAMGMAACIVAACVPLAGWALASALRIEGVPVIDSLVHQAVGRVSQSFAHGRNVLWYVSWVLPFLLPWAFLLRWRRLPGALRQALGTGAGRFGVSATLPAFVMFSLISGKQLHYLLPLLPGAALLFSGMHAADPRVFSFGRVHLLLLAVALAWAWPVANAVIGMQGNMTWYVAALASAGLLALGVIATHDLRAAGEERALRQASFASLMALMAAVLLVGAHMKARMNVVALADEVRALQGNGTAVAVADDEPGMVTYLARLPRPLPRITDAAGWVRENPRGWVLMHASHGSPPAFARRVVVLSDGWEGLVPVSRLAQMR